MTKKQKEDFLLYGCMSRAIMKVCGQNSVEEFCARYEKWFRPEYYGMPRGDKLSNIFADLGYNPIADESDFDSVFSRFKNGDGIIALSHVSFNRGETNELNHASVIHDMSDSSFQIWTSSQDGSAGILPPFDKQFWTDKKFHGLSLTISK